MPPLDLEIVTPLSYKPLDASGLLLVGIYIVVIAVVFLWPRRKPRLTRWQMEDMRRH